LIKKTCGESVPGIVGIGARSIRAITGTLFAGSLLNIFSGAYFIEAGDGRRYRKNLTKAFSQGPGPSRRVADEEA
jgi:hypothetical protein